MAKDEKQSCVDLKSAVAKMTEWSSAFICNHEGKMLLSTLAASAVSSDETK